MSPSPMGPDDPVLGDFLRALKADPEGLLGELKDLAHAGLADARPTPAAVPPSAHPPSRPSIGPGSELGDYRLGELLGTGGMGEVYEAVNCRSNVPGNRFAIKILRPDVTISNASDRFRNEFLKLKELGRANNIVPLIDALSADDVVYMVMPLVGGSLAGHLARKNGAASPWDWSADVVRQIASALLAISRTLSGLVHRDLKPANVLLEDVPDSPTFPNAVHVLVCDFGLAIIPGAARSGLKTCLRLGTVPYFSPEYVRDASDLGPRSDLFSLGIIAYELVTGRHPFLAADNSTSAVMGRIIRGEYAPILKIQAGVPGPLVGLIERLLSQSPKDRPLPLRVVEELDTLLDRRVVAGLTARVPPSSPSVPHHLEPDPGEIFGRDGPVTDGPTVAAEAAAAADLTAATRSRLYWGLGGIGKSTFALKVAHHPTVAAAFRDRRYHIRLDGVRSAAAVEDRVADALGLTGSDRIRVLDALLQDGTSRLLVLDTLDTPTEHDRAGVDRLLTRWGRYPRLTFIHTARSPLWPTGDWVSRVEIPPLSAGAVGQVFLAVAGRFAADSRLDRVLKLADGVPLAARLLAYLVIESDSIESFLRQWDKASGEVFDPAPADRNASVHRTVAFSLNHTRLRNSAPAGRLLRLLADLPDGLFLADVAAGLPELDLDVAIPPLRSVGGLVRIGDDRLTILAPIRDELRRLLPRHDEDWRAAIVHLARRVRTASSSYRDTGDADALVWFRVMQQNVEIALADGLVRQLPESIDGVMGLARFGERLGIDYRQALSTAAEQATSRDRAICRGMIADVLEQQGQVDEALRIRREEELPVYERLGLVRSKAVTMGKIADVLEQQGQVDEALRIRREEELPVYERLGLVREKAVTMGQIADVLEQQGQVDEALRIRREEELPVYERLGLVRLKAVTMGRIADVLKRQGRVDEALRIYREDVLPVLTSIPDAYWVMRFKTQLAKGLVRPNRNENGNEARDLLMDALALSQQLRSPFATEIRSLLNEWFPG
ncbi:protein kinase domain-containing protein [Frigoriglobus tundricola]|uniref:Adenylate cyclase n=1 Tax=Frigoriglobus tundricola TaxID=2774151 RepID=A0A6M5YWM7_9BACT|nr:protein kinase [Frigoriglobus tundricola]QJW98435.1 Adenylate cyclase [Frigoriglobus tundricola]